MDTLESCSQLDESALACFSPEVGKTYSLQGGCVTQALPSPVACLALASGQLCAVFVNTVSGCLPCSQSLTFLSYICTVSSRVKTVYHASYVEEQSSHLYLHLEPQGSPSWTSRYSCSCLLWIISNLVMPLMLCHGYNCINQCQQIHLGYTSHNVHTSTFPCCLSLVDFLIHPAWEQQRTIHVK